MKRRAEIERYNLQRKGYNCCINDWFREPDESIRCINDRFSLSISKCRIHSGAEFTFFFNNLNNFETFLANMLLNIPTGISKFPSMYISRFCFVLFRISYFRKYISIDWFIHPLAHSSFCFHGLLLTAFSLGRRWIFLVWVSIILSQSRGRDTDCSRGSNFTLSLALALPYHLMY